MKSLKAYLIFGAIFVSIAGTLLHFAYEWSNYSPVIAFFAPINESTWEHMKLLFFPMVVFSIFVTTKLKKQYPCIESGLALGAIIGTFLIPIIFYTYSGVLGFNLDVLNISAFYICVAVAFYSAFKLAQSCGAEKYSTLLFAIQCAILLLFFIFTIYPPDIALFKSPQ